MSENIDDDNSHEGTTLQSDRCIANLDISKLLIFHFVICSVGLMGISMFIAGLLAKSIHLPDHLVANLYPWANKPQE